SFTLIEKEENTEMIVISPFTSHLTKTWLNKLSYFFSYSSALKKFRITVEMAQQYDNIDTHKLTHTHTHTHTHPHTHTHSHARTHTHTHTHSHARTRTHTPHTHIPNTHTHT